MSKVIAAGATGEIFASAARTAAPTAVEFRLAAGCRGIMLFLDVTAITGSPTLTPSVNIKDTDGAGDTEPIATFTAISPSANDHRIYIVYPGAVETGALTPVEMQGVPCPVHGTISIAHGDADSATYTMSYQGLS